MRFLAGFSGRTASVASACAAVAGLALLMWPAAPALSMSSDCERLRHAIADGSHGGQGGQLQAAADRQRSEIERTVAYSHTIGCDNHKFLIFGTDPPAQCGQIGAQIGRMRANLEDLQGRSGGGGGARGDLVARFNAQCTNQQDRPSGVLDALFGQPKPSDVREEPLSPDGDLAPVEKSTEPMGEARAGGKAVCVRACDGAFFPVSYSASGGRLDALQDMCRALCPNADVALYTYPTSGTIEQSVSITGSRYMDSPTALRFRQTYDPTCSCRRRGQSWASALAPAEAKLGHEDKSDILVTPEKAAELSRPKADVKATDPKAKPIKGLAGKTPNPGPSPTSTPSAATTATGTDVNGVDVVLSQAAAAISREGSGIAGNGDVSGTAPVGEHQGKEVESVGPDGVKRKVRIVGPTL